MLAYVIVFGILIGACYWILIPLLSEKDHHDGFTPKPEDILENLKNKKDGVYAAIRELEFDLNMGKLSDEDFQILKRQYLREAAGYMQEMDKLESSKVAISMEADLGVGEGIGQELKAAGSPESAKAKNRYCTACGKKAAAESRYCTACGTRLHKNPKNDDRGEI